MDNDVFMGILQNIGITFLKGVCNGQMIII